MNCAHILTHIADQPLNVIKRWNWEILISCVTDEEEEAVENGLLFDDFV